MKYDKEVQDRVVELALKDMKIFLDLIEEKEGIEIGRELSFLEALKMTIYEVSDFDTSVVVIGILENFKEHPSFDYLAIENITTGGLDKRYEQYKKIKEKKEKEKNERL